MDERILNIDPHELELQKKNLPWVPPFDPRFPNTNQKRNCVQNYLDFHRCEMKLGKGDSKCQYYKKAYKNLCPMEWYQRWDGQREEGKFPVKL